MKMIKLKYVNVYRYNKNNFDLSLLDRKKDYYLNFLQNDLDMEIISF